MSKRIWLSHGLPTPRFVCLEGDTSWQALQAVASQLGLPLMLKAPHEGSSIGIAKVEAISQLQAGFDECIQYDEVVLAEEFITGREVTVPVIGSGTQVRALPIVEIRAPEGNYDYQHKYFSDATQYLCPAPLDTALTKKIQALAVQAFKVLGGAGWARVDFMLRAGDNEATLLELNPSPGMTSHSLVPMAAKAAGMTYEDLCVEILQLATLHTARIKERK
jgi:D-alanine-D-alanine ligase